MFENFKKWYNKTVLVKEANIGGISMSLIGKRIEEFDVPAYYDGDIIRVSNKDLEGKWSVE